jgi:hypothetical protein
VDRETQLANTSVLMLSTGYEPLYQTNWKRALTAILGGRAEIIEVHSHLTIGTSRGSIPFPLKVRFITGVILRNIKRINTYAQLSRKNIFLRDKGRCQYCGMQVTSKSGTVDHIVPRSRGGMHVWENVVIACIPCNQKKGARLVDSTNMSLIKKPKSPTISEIAYRQII